MKDYTIVEWDCPTCRRREFFAHDQDRHVCAPSFEITHYDVAGEPDWDEASRVRAADAKTAVEDWAQSYGSDGDYRIVSGQSEPIVWVRDADGTVTKWRVRGYVSHSYTASEVPA